jgi:hypothetical protein
MSLKVFSKRFVGILFCINMLFIVIGGFSCLVDAESISINEGSEWYFFKGIRKPPDKWSHIDFNRLNEGWLKGRTGLGYGHQKVQTNLNDMKGRYQIVYARREVNVDESVYRLLKLNSTRIIFSITCDGPFRALLNGIEVIRSDNERLTAARGRFEASDIDITAFAREFLYGKNVIAVECSNDDIDSSDFLFMPVLKQVKR